MALKQKLEAAWGRYRRQSLAASVALLLGAGVWVERAPVLRVVNATAEPVELWIDGKRKATLPPTTTETPGAGLELWLSPGMHRFLVKTPGGAPLDERSADLPANSNNLFTPGESDQCFWVEHTAYGQARPELPARRQLAEGQRLWMIPDEIDAWFFPTPPATPDRRSSGGTRTAIRQARCGFEPWR